MTEAPPLTEQDLEDFNTLGYTKIRAFSAEDAGKMEEMIWHRMEKFGVSRDDQTTWEKVRAGGLSQSLRKTRLFRDAITEEFLAAVDQLLSAGE